MCPDRPGRAGVEHECVAADEAERGGEGRAGRAGAALEFTNAMIFIAPIHVPTSPRPHVPTSPHFNVTTLERDSVTT